MSNKKELIYTRITRYKTDWLKGIKSLLMKNSYHKLGAETQDGDFPNFVYYISYGLQQH